MKMQKMRYGKYVIATIALLLIVGVIYVIQNSALMVKAADDEDCVKIAGFTVTSDTGGFSIEEGGESLVDNDTITKWCTNSTIDNKIYIEFKAENALIPKEYILTTGNDTGTFPERNPNNWKLYGKLNQDDEWSVIDEITNDQVLQDEDYAAYSFEISEDKQKQYKYFRFEVLEHNDVMQLSEFKFVCDSFFASSVEYSSSILTYSAPAGSILKVQGSDFVYSLSITEDAINKSITSYDIKEENGLNIAPNLRNCQIWIEKEFNGELCKIFRTEYVSIPVTCYATKNELMDSDCFTLHNSMGKGVAKQLYFGNDGSNAYKWYIVGSDADNSIVLMCDPNSPMEYTTFNSNSNEKSYYDEMVYANHYGASQLRETIKRLQSSEFTAGEQSMMLQTKIYLKDEKNSSIYSINDKLYLAHGGLNEKEISLGANSANDLSGTIKIDIRKDTFDYDDFFWLRTAYQYDSDVVLYSACRYYVNADRVYIPHNVVPAFRLDLSSVLFASAAKSVTTDTMTGIIYESTPMTLRLDGSGKDLGTAIYNDNFIKVTKGNTSGDVFIVVQGNDGRNQWYYSELITEDTIVNIKDVGDTFASYGITNKGFSTCKIWLETKDENDNIIYAVPATESEIEISNVAITGITEPTLGSVLDTTASCLTLGIFNTAPIITWSPVDNVAGYNTSYTAKITLNPEIEFVFADNMTVTLNGQMINNAIKDEYGNLVVSYTFDATDKDRLTSILEPQSIIVENGTTYENMNLPTTVTIETEGNTVDTAKVSWDTATPISGSYDPILLSKQTVTLKGTVTCPDNIDANGVALTTKITITINAADKVSTPTVSLTPGTYTDNQNIVLSTATNGATIYYTITTDGTEPAIPSASSTAYTTPIALTGTLGESVTITVKAIAIKDRMYDSEVETFKYIINLPNNDPKDYEITYEDDKTWTTDSEDNFGLKVNGDVSKLTGVKIDGKLIDAKNYNTNATSNTISLTAEYLSSLSVGNHTIEMVWSDGFASTNFTISEAEKNTEKETEKDTEKETDADIDTDSPETGDGVSTVWLYVLLLAGGMGVVLNGSKVRGE